MPGHVKANLTKITQMASQLDGLADQFQNLTQVADVGSAAGNPALESALSGFASGWSDKRGQFIKEMQALAKTARQAVQGYTDTDNTLASDLAKASSGKGK
jgi:hypothetical protein